MSFTLDRPTGISPFEGKIGASNSINGKVEKMLSGNQNYLDFLKPLYRVLDGVGLLLPERYRRRSTSATGDRYTKEDEAKQSVFKQLSVRNWLLVIFAYLFLLHSIINSGMVRGKMNFLKWSAVIQRIIEASVTVFSLNHFLTSENDIYRIYQSCTKYVAQLPPLEVTRLRKRCVRLVLNILIGFILGYAVLPHALKSREFYVGSTFYGLNTTYEEFTQSQSSLLVTLDFSLRNFLDSVSLILMFVFVSVSYFIGASAKFYELKLIETKDTAVVTPEALHQVQKYHGEITDLCQKTDVIFTRITLAWYFDLVQRFLLLIPAILTSVKEDPFYIYFGLGIQFLFYSYVFTSMSLSASKVKEVSHDGMLTVHRISNKIPSSDWHSLNLIVNLMGMMSTSQMHLTAWNFFVIDRSLILTVLSMVLTYTVVVIQFFSV